MSSDHSLTGTVHPETHTQIEAHLDAIGADAADDPITAAIAAAKDAACTCTWIAGAGRSDEDPTCPQHTDYGYASVLLDVFTDLTTPANDTDAEPPRVGDKVVYAGTSDRWGMADRKTDISILMEIEGDTTAYCYSTVEHEVWGCPVEEIDVVERATYTRVESAPDGAA